jgi:hypothetical protein
MQQDLAERIGLEALAWIAGQDDLLTVFLGSSGASVDDLKKNAQDADFIASILDFLLMDDAWVVGFCDQCGHSYDIPMRARAALPGGAEPHWT